MRSMHWVTGGVILLLIVLLLNVLPPVSMAQQAPTATFGMPDLPTIVPPTPLPDHLPHLDLLLTLEAHQGMIMGLAFAPDGTMLATLDEDGAIHVWDTATWTLAREIRTERESLELAWSPDGALLASAGGVWRAADGELLYALDRSTLSVGFAPDSKWLAFGGLEGAVHVQAVDSDVPFVTLTEHTNPVLCVTFSPDGRLLAASSGLAETAITVWDTQTWDLVQTFDYRGAADVNAVAFSPDGAWLAVGSTNHTIDIWDVATGDREHTFRYLQRGVYDVDFSPDGTLVASAGDDFTLRVWYMPERVSLRVFRHPSEVMTVAFSPDGSLLVAGNFDGTVRIYNIE